jgi:hypothetical protein
MDTMNYCIYCPEPADSLEHPLPAALGEFEGAPYLKGRICRGCNNNRLGILDEQFARCGPEGFLRKFYGVQGRSSHDEVNSFYRGSAGGHRLEMKTKDPKLGIEILVECENGTFRQLRQLVFVEKSGKTQQLPIREGATPEQLRADVQGLCLVQPYDVHVLYDPENETWVQCLMKETWPQCAFGEGNLASTSSKGAVINVKLTDRYFRAMAKIGFHYFLTQLPQYSGHEPMFSEIRTFILEGGGGVGHANDFIGRRQIPLLGEMQTGARPAGWRAHLLCAEIKPGECLAHLQMFISEDWPAPAYTVRLARQAALSDTYAVGHAYVYYADGPKGKYSGEANCLTTLRTNFPAPPLAPVIASG